MENNKKFQAVNFFSCIFWLLTFCYIVFLWATDSPKFMFGLTYGVTFSAIVGIVLIIFKVRELDKQKVGDIKKVKKNLKFSDLNLESFEDLLIRLFGAMSYIVECIEIGETKGFILYKNKVRAFVMFDCNESLDDSKILNQIKSGIKENKCHKGIFVCSSKINKNILKKAESGNIDIVDKKYLQELLLSYLSEKWQ